MSTPQPYYADDMVTLYHGDCRAITAWLEADVLVTDPPYGIGGPGGRRRNAHPAIEGDADTSTRDAALILWGDARTVAVFGSFDRPEPRGKVFTLVYRKAPDAGSVGGRAGFRRDIEAVYLTGPWPLCYQGRSSLLETGSGKHSGSGGLTTRYGHPHAKPVDVMETLIAACPPGVITDPFAGSGSTLVAARNLGRKAIGIELEERYCEAAARRLQQDVLIVGAVS
jgi:site-specific DNA-methyltransferase (adenine-specific)